MAGLPIAVDITPSDAPREHVTVLLAACARASAEAECVPAEGVPVAGSRAVALVTWQGDRRAVIEVGLRKDGRPTWRSRTLNFDARDALTERWRTVGFVVGTLSRPEVEVPETETTSTESPAKASEVAPKVADSRAAPASQAPSKPRKPSARPSPAQRPEVSPSAPPRAEADRPSAVTADIVRSAAVASLDVGGVVGSALEGVRFGGLARARFAIAEPLNAIVAVRYQERPLGDGSFGGRWVAGAAGVALHFSGGPLELSVSLDGRAEYFQARAVDGARQDVSSRVLPGAGLGIHAGWMPADAIGLFVGVDGSAVFGTTDVFVRDSLAAKDFPLRAAAEGGVRLRLW